MNPHMIRKEKSIIAPYLVLHSCKWSQKNSTTVNKHSTHHIAIVEALKKKDLDIKRTSKVLQAITIATTYSHSGEHICPKAFSKQDNAR